MSASKNQKKPVEKQSQCSVRSRGISSILGMLAIVMAIQVSSPSLRADSETQEPIQSHGDVLVVVGASGQPAYAEAFNRAAKSWEKSGKEGGARVEVLGLDEPESEPSVSGSTREQLEAWFATNSETSSELLWLVFIGHGSYDGRTAKLNLRGPDVSAAELRQWLQPVDRPMVIVHGGAASAPFVNALSAPNRIIVSATESGHEINYARFGTRFAAAIADPAADIDRDGQTSVLEAFVSASHHTETFYEEQNRLSTEHALIDDNGDGQGTPFDWFNGTRLAKRPQDETSVPDGSRARLISLIPSPEEQALTEEQRLKRAHLESLVEQLRTRKASLPEIVYYQQLEDLFRKLSVVYGFGTEEPAE